MSDLTFASSPAVIAHVNLLQGIINRLANNSAQCKTWTVTLVSALFAAAASLRAPPVALAALVPLVLLGYMDIRYLAAERAYRRLYNETTGKVRSGTYQLADIFQAGVAATSKEIVSTIWSWAIFPVYPGMAILLLVAWGTGLLDRLGTAVVGQ